jgi:hypothetical protein
MDKQKLVGGIAVLALIAGGLLTCFTPGGFLQAKPEERTVVDTPLVDVRVTSQEEQPGLVSPGPIAGFVLLGLGAVGVVAALAMKPQS